MNQEITLSKENIKFTLYPDNQPHVNISGVKAGDRIRLVCPIRSSLELVQLLQISNALSHLYAVKSTLVIPYLMAARFDRVMEKGDSFDLEVVAELINSCGFDRVHLFDAHSDAATALIHRSHNHDNRKLVKQYSIPHSVLICPDAGAVKKVASYLEWNPNIVDVVYCVKKRDLSTGKIALKLFEPEKCANRNCVIIDDICDGGATFIAISEQVPNDALSLTLIVSHGIFSKGTDIFQNHFDKIITSDSYMNHQETKLLNVIPLNL